MSSTTVTAVLTGTAVPAASATAPVLVIGSSSITAGPAPFSLPVIEPSFLAGLIPDVTGAAPAAPSGTVYGTGVGNYSIVPFVPGSAAVKSSDFATAIWGTAMAVVVMALGLM